MEPKNAQNYYIIPPFQRAFGWGSTLTGGFTNDLINLFNMGLREHTLGDILVYKPEEKSTENHVGLGY